MVVVVQIGVFVTHFMAIVAYFTFLYRSLSRRKAIRAKLNLGEHTLSAPEAVPIPSAAVVAPPPAADHRASASSRRAGPVAEGSEAGTSPEADSTEEPPSLGGSATLTLRSPATYTDTDGGPPPEPHATWRLPSAPQPPAEISGDATHAFGGDSALQRGSAEKVVKRSSFGGALPDASASEMDSVMPLTAEEVDEATREEPRGCWDGTVAFLRQAWDGVKEEPKIGFRCCSHSSSCTAMHGWHAIRHLMSPAVPYS